MYEELKIDRLGQRGEGVAEGAEGAVYVSYALPGEIVRADVEGERGTLYEIIKPSTHRIAPFCPHYGLCGGCAVQALAPDAYAEWKRGLVVAALRNARIEAEVAPLLDAHGVGRRRATFHARVTHDALNRARVVSGFMKARAHDIVDIDACPILAPELQDAPAIAQALAETLAALGKPLDITITATPQGLDVDFRGTGPLDAHIQQGLVKMATRCDLARLSNHGEIVIERRMPRLPAGRALLTPPPGAFLQATQAGENALTTLVDAALSEHAPKAKRVADLFAGVGTFALRLAERSVVHAVETDAAALKALAQAAHNAAGLKTVTTEQRDLSRRPLMREELPDFDAVVMDPPRAGAETQSRAFAESRVPLVISVSCNVQTFARDARLLIDGGYTMGVVTPVDQFRHSAHVEMVAAFTRKAARSRRLLG